MKKISNKTVDFAKAIFIAALIATIIAVLSSCSNYRVIGKGYITYIEREKSDEFKKFTSIESIDSLVNTTFDYAGTFNADSIFKVKNLFTVENETNFIYIEQKNLVEKPNGRIKFKTIK